MIIFRRRSGRLAVLGLVVALVVVVAEGLEHDPAAAGHDREPTATPPRSPSGPDARFPGANYPNSTAITGIAWGPPLRRIGCGDNLPVTWAGDSVITAFGDCGGPTRDPASTTVSRITDRGDPVTATATTEWQLQEGVGPAGRKISGLLSLHGTLYALFRNARPNGTGSQLGWSTDGGVTWAFAAWNWESTGTLGYPTFVNYGRDGAGSPDPFVYIVSPDSPSAYSPSADPARQGMVLVRVPANRIREASAYRYFAGASHGQVTWSVDPGQRALVFRCPVTRCLRSQIAYDPGLHRYLWWQQAYQGTPDTRWSGGFGVYESAFLLGPWRTVYFTRDAVRDATFRDGPGDGGSFPTKWMSADGASMYFVCSCKNTFTIRRAALTLGP
jgi:hypothetical protein